MNTHTLTNRLDPQPAPGNAAPASPLVSVITPTYNRSDYLPETLESLRAQTLPDAEIVIVDDGSTDATAELIRSWPEPLRYFWQENAGPAAARNHGLRMARGQFVAFLDSDDLWEPRFLEVMTRRLLDDPQIDIAFCRFLTIDDNRQVLRRHRKRPHAGQITAQLFASTFITTPSVVARREAILGAGGFNPTLQTNEDYDLWLRLSLKHRFGFVDESLCLRRSHPGTQSRNGSAAPLVRKAQLLERFYQEHANDADLPRDLVYRRLARVYSSAAHCSQRLGQHDNALQLYRRSLEYRRLAPKVWFRYALASLLRKNR